MTNPVHKTNTATNKNIGAVKVALTASPLPLTISLHRMMQGLPLRPSNTITFEIIAAYCVYFTSTISSIIGKPSVIVSSF